MTLSHNKRAGANAISPLPFKRVFAGLCRYFPLLAERLGYQLYFWVPPRRPDGIETRISQLSKKTQIQFGELVIPVYEWSKPNSLRTVLFLHGWGGAGTQVGYFVQELVSAGCRVISFDAPGHGKASGRSTTVNQIADVAHDIAQTISGELVIVGHSVGALAACHTASRLGCRVHKVALLAPIYSFDTLLSVFAEMTGADERVKKYIQRRTEQRYGVPWMQSSGEQVVNGLTPMALILNDEQDPRTPREHMEKLASGFVTSQHETFEKVGHYRILRDIGVASRLRAFVSNPVT